MSSNIKKSVEAYTNAGIETMPIPYNKKSPPRKGWTEMSVGELWQDIAEPTNIAVIAGRNNFVIIDPDSSETVTHLKSYFEGLGVKHIGTKTKRGEHWWMRSAPSENFQKKSAKLRAPLEGEFRIQNGYALAAPSAVEETLYEQIGNPFETPFVEWKDLKPLLGSEDAQTEENYEGIPIPIIRRTPPDFVRKLIEVLKSAPKGEAVQSDGREWKSRSEAAQTAIDSMLLHGYTPEEIEELIDIKDKSDYWYEFSINKGIQFVSNTGLRPTLAKLYHTPIKLQPRTGSVDYSVFQAAVAQAWLRNESSLFLPVRNLALLSATDKDTVSDSIQRLVHYGLLIPQESVHIPYSQVTMYRYSISGSSLDSLNTLINDDNVIYVPKSGQFPELWRREALGKAALHIYMSLTDKPKDMDTIQELTGISRSPFYEAIGNLEQNNLAAKSGKCWIKGNANIDELEEKYECRKSALKRLEGILKEREKGYKYFNGKDELFSNFIPSQNSR